MTNKELQNKLYKDYGLDANDFFKHQHYTIITRTGIEKIQAGSNIAIRYEEKVLEPGFAVIKAYATKGDVTVETYGSAKYGNYKEGTTNTWYVAEMSEKRALSRAVLKIENLYQHGVFGESESDDFKDDRKPVPSQQLALAESAILRAEVTAEEAIERLEEKFILPDTVKYAWKQLKPKK